MDIVDGYAVFGELPTVSEARFCKLMPLLLSKDTKRSREAWLPVVGNLRVRCNVVDSKGNILFWVPPLEVGFDFNAPEQFNALVAESHVRSNVSEKQADELLARAFLSSTDAKVHTPDEHLEQWKMILNRYGLLREGLDAPVEEKEVDYGIDIDDEEDW